MSCVDGLSHSWHFFKRGFKYRQCKKCAVLQRWSHVFQGRAWLTVGSENERYSGRR